MDTNQKETIKQMVKDAYGGLTNSSACCGTNMGNTAFLEEQLDYSKEDLECALETQMPLLGCGNPVAEAAPAPGETVVDLGSGAGMDAFLSARRVGSEGRVIGIDMTPEMVARAKENAERLSMGNVSFKLGEIENLPVPDNTADVVMSNCVINLSPDKAAVYREIYRVLKPGGRISISDVLKSGEIPLAIMEDPVAYTG
ncbi:MAG: methyltransferase domain-containing protein [Thermodesulfobacteriota bacterium]|nr:methyltransferase domain-containing protein [Thermodesulfobacteriota bacterium]